ncbi:putative bifunctional diguanylate cyclase/phosphodiesterase [Lichenicoccus sp.]|uniref:putative bifunctional diguanylate cyclase/phosphodiesterase n=1 Tax=Lichenicoccus sp. TaxID=2781899 RepID=UPI003D0AE48C
MPIRGKILSGCLALTLLTALLGVFAERAERRLGFLAFDIYDNAFMSVSYLREAQMDFGQMARGSAPGSPPGSTASRPAAAVAQEILDDLDVVRARAMSPSGREQAEALRRNVAALLPGIAADPAGVVMTQQAFDRLVETFAGDGFTYRRTVGRMVALQRRQTWGALIVSVAAAMTITALITRLIAPPVRRAVRIAQSIAAGRLDNPIAATGRGETADLMRALSVMQSSIASGMRRIQALMDQQAQSHAGEIAAQHAQMQAALANMNQGLCLFGADGSLRVANTRFAEMFGAPVLGRSADEVLRAAGLASLIDISRDGLLETFSCELEDGRIMAVSQQPIAGGGWVATYEDVSERRAAERRLAHMARHDLLTGLPNRLLFEEHMREALASLAPNDGLAVLCLDLDRFKLVNDTLGHGIGDDLLRLVAARLRGCVREEDLVVRLGGDEFAIIQLSRGQDSRGPALLAAKIPAFLAPKVMEQPQEVTMLAQRVIERLSAPFEVDQHQIGIGASVGIALSSDPSLSEDDQRSPQALLKCADLALYRAKAAGRGNFHFFEPDMDTRMQARRRLEQDLRLAVSAQQFELYYQPLMESGAGLSGFEALLRWNHPERGLVSPVEFIPLAEEVGLIPVIGRWALQRACADAAAWPATLKVAVNLSPLQFRPGLAAEVADALAASGLSARRLELEITESLLLQDDAAVLATLHRIRALGVRIAMDDFGTGYSSLGYLRRFPFDKIKIDQSFVRGMIDQADCLAIVRAVIGLGRSLGIAINAEGVETTAQHQALLREGCDELQGFLFSRPRPASEVASMVQQLGPASSREPTLAREQV